MIRRHVGDKHAISDSDVLSPGQPYCPFQEHALLSSPHSALGGKGSRPLGTQYLWTAQPGPALSLHSYRTAHTSRSTTLLRGFPPGIHSKSFSNSDSTNPWTRRYQEKEVESSSTPRAREAPPTLSPTYVFYIYRERGQDRERRR